MPQFSRSLVRSKHPGCPGQSVIGDAHGTWHTPPLHTSPVVHTWPQLPQLVQSVAVSASHPPPPPLLLPLLLDESAWVVLPDSVDASSPPVCAGLPPVAQARKEAVATPPPRTRTEMTAMARD